jgi:hypothetical protein
MKEKRVECGREKAGRGKKQSQKQGIEEERGNRKKVKIERNGNWKKKKRERE